MSNRLTIGVVEGEFGVRSMLDAIGVTSERAERGVLDPLRYSVIVVDRFLSDEEADAIDEYLRAGGAVLDLGWYAKARRMPTSRRRIGAVRGDADGPFRHVWLLDVDRTVPTPLAATALGGLASLEEHSGGWLVRLPLNVYRLAREHAPRRHRFASPNHCIPDEVVARRARNEYRKAIEGALAWLHASRGIPFAQKWRFPGSSESLFAFRVDTDYSSSRELDELRRLCDEHSIGATWFLHVGAHEPDIDFFERFDGHEIALHGYRHRAFPDYEGSWGNVAEAMLVLRAAGHDPVGFAAPTGLWSRGLDHALEDLGLLYSSEFTLDYDGLPFHPWNGARGSRVLQVPVHPISPGALMRIGAGDREIEEYFSFVLRRKLSQGEPVFFYHHPTQGAVIPIERVFRQVREEGIPALTMREYAEWWIARSACAVEAEFDGGSVRVDAGMCPPDVTVRITRPDGAVVHVTGDSCVALTDVSFTHRPEREVEHRVDPTSVRGFSLRALRHGIEDTYSRMRQ